MQQSYATILGFFAASVVPAVYLAKASPVPTFHGAHFLTSFSIYYICSAIATLALGVPAYFVAKKFSKVTWWSAVSAGVLIGSCVQTAVTYPYSVLDEIREYALIGGAAGFAFWTIWQAGVSNE